VATTLLCCHNLTNCSPSYNPLEENCKTVSQIFQSFSLNSATRKCNICNNFATSFGFQTCYIVLPISRTLQPWTRILMIVNSFKPNTVCVLANFDRPVFLSVKNTSFSWTNLLFRLVESYWDISCWPVLEVAHAHLMPSPQTTRLAYSPHYPHTSRDVFKIKPHTSPQQLSDIAEIKISSTAVNRLIAAYQNQMRLFCIELYSMNMAYITPPATVKLCAATTPFCYAVLCIQLRWVKDLPRRYCLHSFCDRHLILWTRNVGQCPAWWPPCWI